MEYYSCFPFISLHLWFNYHVPISNSGSLFGKMHYTVNRHDKMLSTTVAVVVFNKSRREKLRCMTKFYYMEACIGYQEAWGTI
jgi:hypothetical protein